MQLAHSYMKYARNFKSENPNFWYKNANAKIYISGASKNDYMQDNFKSRLD